MRVTSNLHVTCSLIARRNSERHGGVFMPSVHQNASDRALQEMLLLGTRLYKLKVGTRTHPYPKVTGQVSTAATPYSRIREVLGSNPGRNIAYRDLYSSRFPLRLSGRMPGQRLQ
jgi:hypothetical protein